MFITLNNTTKNKRDFSFLLIFFISIGIFITKTNIANAQVGAITCDSGAIFGSIGKALGIGGGGGVAGLAGGGAVPISSTLIENNTQAVKNVQCTWNGIAWQLAHIALHELTGNVIDWINGGFHGSPAFLTNPTGFFTTVGDDLTAAFIAGNGPLQSLCSPFNTDVRLAISLDQVSYNKPYRCSLSTIINNAQNATINGRSISGFMNGDFSQGGMAGFVALGGPSNNPGRVYLQAQSDLIQRSNAKQGQYQRDLLQGSGFLNYRDCKDISEEQVNDLGGQGLDQLGAGDTGISAGDNSTWYSQNGGNINIVKNGDGTVKYQSCQDLTPGSVISSALNKQLGAPTDELNLTQDINQVVSLLFSRLLTDTLSGGLFSASQNSASIGNQSITNRLKNNDTQTQANVKALQKQAGYQIFEGARSAQEAVKYRGQIIFNLTNENKLYKNTASCFSARIEDANNNQDNSSYLQNQLDQVNNSIAGLDTQIFNATEDLYNASNTIAIYQDWALRIQNASSIDESNKLTNQFQTQVSSIPYDAASDPVIAQNDLVTTNANITALEKSRKTYQAACNNQAI